MVARKPASSRVPAVAPSITQKLLVSAGGWPAMKQAQQLQAAGRASEIKYEPPLLSGVVREGNRNLHSGLRIKTESDVENLCTCRESREWGKICPHALAVGVAYLAEASASKVPAPPFVAPAISSVTGPTFVELGSEAATPIALHLILPPNFETAWTKRQVMLVTEIELNGTRLMPSALLPNERYSCDTFDLGAIAGFRELAPEDEALTAMRLYPGDQFLRLLRALRGHPRVTFGKATSVEISSKICRPRLCLKRDQDGSVRLEPLLGKDERLLAAGGESWILHGHRFSPLREGLPNGWKELAAGAVTFRKERAQRFLAFEAPGLREWFEIETDTGFAMPDVETAKPRFVLKTKALWANSAPSCACATRMECGRDLCAWDRQSRR